MSLNNKTPNQQRYVRPSDWTSATCHVCASYKKRQFAPAHAADVNCTEERVLNSREDAYQLLDNLNAPEHLTIHVRLVGEAADLVIEKLEELEVSLNFEFIRIGVAIHDIGKIVHTNEMTGPGSEHEPEGERILLEKGVEPEVARCCLSHARFESMSCSIEELCIALSDKLWKGKRVESLELKVIDHIAKIKGVGRWDIFADLDSCFETVAAGGHERLQRSVAS